MTTQNFVHGVDFTGVTEITPALLNQLVDLAIPNVDKGLILVTNDTALNTPDVPNATTNTDWQRYIWIRIPHSTDEDVTPIIYGWNENVTSIATYLKWKVLIADTTNFEADIAALSADNVNNKANIANLQEVVHGDADTTGLEALVNTANTNALAATAAVTSKLNTADLDTSMATALGISTSPSKAAIKLFVENDQLKSMKSDITAIQTQLGTSPVTNYVRVLETATGNSAVVSTKTSGLQKLKRKLNTLVPSTSSLVTISSDSIIINYGGTYEISFGGVLYIRHENSSTIPNGWQLVLATGTDPLPIAVGFSNTCIHNNAANQHSFSDSGTCIIELAKDTVLSLYHYIKRRNTGDDITGGLSASAGGPYECYAEVFLRKIA